MPRKLVKRIGIVVALSAEARSLCREGLPPGRPVELDRQRLLIVSGAGPRAAARAAECLAEEAVDGLVSWGCAAALDPTLRPGDLILPRTILSPSGPLLAVTSGWRECLIGRLAGRLPFRDGPLLGSENIVVSAEKKKELFERTGAAALDMESAAVALVAQERALPVLAVRTVADPSTMSLPSSVQVSMDDFGQVRLSRLLSHTLRHPSDLLGLARLGLHFRAALDSLQAVARLGPGLVP